MDKRKAVPDMLTDEEWKAWSDREIARRCRVHHNFVGKLRAELHTGDISSMRPTERTFTHHKTGKPTTMQTMNIRKKDDDIEAVALPRLVKEDKNVKQQRNKISNARNVWES